MSSQVDVTERGPGGAPAGNTNAVKHGMWSVAAHGASKLPVELQARELEIAENLGTKDGILRELEQSAYHYILVAETGLAYFRRILDAGGNPWSVGADHKPIPLLKTLGTYMAGAVRTLEKLTQLRGDKDTIDMAEGMAAGPHEGATHED